MIAFFVCIYSFVLFVLFRFKIVKPRPLPVVLSLVVGVLMIGAIVVAWLLCSPVSMRVVTTQYVIQLVPYVKGQVTKVHAQAVQPVKKGDLLLEINPAPYQFTVDQLKAQLAGAQNNVRQAQAGMESAVANVAKAKAGVNQAAAALDQARATVANAESGLNKAKAGDDLAKTQEQIALNLQKTDSGSISTLKVAEATQNRIAADAAVKQAEAGVMQAKGGLQLSEASLTAAKSGEQAAAAAERQTSFAVQLAKSNVPAVQAQLDDAQFNLTQCRMLAPANGYVVNWSVTDGAMLVPMPMTAAGTFINTDDTIVVASFPQNYLTNVVPGNAVELVLDPFPGRLFKGRVEFIIPATGEGQYDPSKTIGRAAQVGSQGMLSVRITLDNDQNLPKLPLGAGGTVAIYTDHGKPVHIISKVTIRLKKWLLFVIPASLM